MSTPSWAPLKRNYDLERESISKSRTEAPIHPLQTNRVKADTVLNSSKKDSSSSITDPLSAGISDPLSSPVIDPLSSFSSKAAAPVVLEALKPSEPTLKVDTKIVTNDVFNWNARKQQILLEYTISGSLTLNSSSLNEIMGSGVEDGSNTKKVDIYTQRLANLERNLHEDKVTMTQKEYSDHIEKLHRDLDTAWANDERVGSLKIAIQIAKLLSDSSVPSYYPSMFVLVTDVLNCFGDMVFNRLKMKAESDMNAGFESNRRSTLRDDFTSADIPQLTKETSRNWFFKIACIRELLPRVLIEITLLRCYRFLTDSDFPQILSRLASLIRGIGDPLVAAYLRTYLALVGYQVSPESSQYALVMVQDQMVMYGMMKLDNHQQYLGRCNISSKEFYRVLYPAFDWLMRVAAKNASKENFQQMLVQYREFCGDTLMLKCILDHFDSSFYCHASLAMSSLIKMATPSFLTIADVYAAMGKAFFKNPPPEEIRIPLLNDVWKAISKVEDITSHVNCSYSWLDTIQKHYTEREALILLADMSNRLQLLTQSDISDLILRQVESMMNSYIGASMGSSVLVSDHFLKVLDVFRGAKKVAICKDILESFRNHGPINDAILINSLFEIGRVLHDSVDCLSPEGEKKHIALLIGSFIDKIDFGKDLEQQLNVYVECRGIFCNLDRIQDKLVLCTMSLACRALKLVKGKHSKKTSSFVKACLAYCHITIPSIADGFRRLLLLITAGQVALLNGCLPQTDTLLKAAISTLPDLNATEDIEGRRVSTEEKLASYIRTLLSTLVLTPGHPEHGPFYIIAGLLNALPKFPWSENSPFLPRLYVDILALICTYAQRRFPYHIVGVESNDDLYGGAPGYLRELGETLNACMEEILKQLTRFAEKSDPISRSIQCKVILDVVNQLMARMELKPDLCEFAVKLLELASKSKEQMGRPERRYWSNTLDAVRYQLGQCPTSVSPSMASVLRGFTN